MRGGSLRKRTRCARCRPRPRAPPCTPTCAGWSSPPPASPRVGALSSSVAGERDGIWSWWRPRQPPCATLRARASWASSVPDLLDIILTSPVAGSLACMALRRSTSRTQRRTHDSGPRGKGETPLWWSRTAGLGRFGMRVGTHPRACTSSSSTTRREVGWGSRTRSSWPVGSSAWMVMSTPLTFSDLTGRTEEPRSWPTTGVRPTGRRWTLVPPTPPGVDPRALLTLSPPRPPRIRVSRTRQGRPRRMGNPRVVGPTWSWPLPPCRGLPRLRFASCAPLSRSPGAHVSAPRREGVSPLRLPLRVLPRIPPGRVLGVVLSGRGGARVGGPRETGGGSLLIPRRHFRDRPDPPATRSSLGRTSCRLFGSGSTRPRPQCPGPSRRLITATRVAGLGGPWFSRAHTSPGTTTAMESECLAGCITSGTSSPLGADPPAR